MSQEEKNIPVEQQRLEKEQIEDMGSVLPFSTIVVESSTS